MDIELKENEEIYDLQCNELKLIQNKKEFCFGIDSILLANYAKNIKENVEVIDLGTGTGIIPTLLCGKTKLKHVTGIEIQEQVCNMARRSIKLNKLEEKFEILNEDINNVENFLKKNIADVVITNPPYKKNNTGIKNENEAKLISRHEVKCTLEQIVKVAMFLLKDKGEFYMIHRPERLTEIINILAKYKLEPKNMRFVYSTVMQDSKLVLIKAIKNAKPFLKVDSPLIVYNEDKTYTEEILMMQKENVIYPLDLEESI